MSSPEDSAEASDELTVDQLDWMIDEPEGQEMVDRAIDELMAGE
jgi:hypothetical protein